MKETIAKIIKTKGWFFEKIKKLINHLPDSTRKEVRRLKSIEFEMKKK